MSYIKPDANSPLAFDVGSMRNLGIEHQEAHLAADPFPHTVIDDFLPPSIIEYCLANFPDKLGAGGEMFDRDQERYKASFHPDEMEPGLRNIFYMFNSQPFISVVENITGIKGLIPDPYFLGAGFHEIGKGGHLSVHLDFNHHKPMDLERRINVLIYLNDDWRPEYGGQLEFWNADMSECVQAIDPIQNRMAVFTLSDKSYHGNPNVVKPPEGRTRRSIALYYYTSTWDADGRDLTTQFKTRKGSNDKIDWDVKTTQAIKEYLPPFLARPTLKLRAKMKHRQQKTTPPNDEAQG